MLFKKVFSLIIIYCIYNQCIGQQQGYTSIPAEYELEHIKLNNKENIGLINHLYEDKEGYLWLSTTKGLHIFDGTNTITYSNNNKQFNLVTDSAIQTLHNFEETATSNFWIQVGNIKLLHYDPFKRKVIESFTNKAINNQPFLVFPSYNNNTVYFTSSDALTNTYTIWQKKSNTTPEIIYKGSNLLEVLFVKLVGNSHWIFEKNKLLKISMDGKKVEQFNMAAPLLRCVFPAEDKTKFYFIDIKQNAIYTYNEQQNKLETLLTLPDNLKGKGPHFFVDGNTIYFGNNLSLFIIDTEHKTIQNLSDNFVELAKKEAPNSLGAEFANYFKRKDGSILACTQSDIYRLKKKVPSAAQFLQKIVPTNSISPIISCRAIAEDDKKNIYVSYYTGIVKKTNNNYHTLDLQKNTKGSPLATYSLHYWKNNLLWNNVSINLATNAITYLVGNKYGGHVTQYLQNDTLWLFQWASKELHCYDLIKKHNTTYPIEIKINFTHNLIAEMNDMVGDDTGQNLWISTTNDGIALITKKGKLVKQYRKIDLGISDDKVTDLECIGENLWFGCDDGLGVLHVPTGKTTIYKNQITINNTTLQNRFIFSILPDGYGNFYLGSSHGLLQFNIKERKFYNLADDHPLANVEFNRASAFKASNGTYYFGSTDGLFSFTANELQFFKASNPIPAIKLYNITLYNNKKGVYEYLTKDLDSLHNWVLQPYNNYVEFSFSVPEFYKKIYYSYRIKGQNNAWTDYELDNKIVLYGLTPGEYTLEVKASTNLSDENASYYNLPIVMKQVWYKKGWVIVLFVLSSLAAIIGFLRYRFNQKLNRQKALANLRTKISGDLHDDVGTILSGLAMQSQMLTYTAKEEQKKPLLEISNMSRDAMERMRDTVWAIDSRKDKVENLVDRMRDFAEKNLAMKNFTHQFEVKNIDSKQFINPEKRQAIYLIFKEAITNIVKHSNGNNVTIHFTEEKNKTILVVKDNGTEKQKSNSDGLGLSNMKMRAEKLGGTFITKYDAGFIADLVI